MVYALKVFFYLNFFYQYYFLFTKETAHLIWCTHKFKLLYGIYENSNKNSNHKHKQTHRCLWNVSMRSARTNETSNELESWNETDAFMLSNFNKTKNILSQQIFSSQFFSFWEFYLIRYTDAVGEGGSSRENYSIICVDMYSFVVCLSPRRW